MTRRTKNMLYILMSILIYFILNFVYHNVFLKDEKTTVYVLKNDIQRGDKVDKTMLESISISYKNSDIYGYITDINMLDDEIYSRDTYKSGQVLTDKMIIKKDEYVKVENNSEVISIKLNDSKSAVSYMLQRGSIVNIYYTGRQAQCENILDKLNKETLLSSTKNDAYISFRLFDSKRILKIMDKYGNELNSENEKSETDIIDTILIEVTKEEANLVNNLSKYGEFTCTIVK